MRPYLRSLCLWVLLACGRDAAASADSLLHQVLSPKNCYQSAATFRGCVAGLDAFEYNENGFHLYPANDRQHSFRRRNQVRWASRKRQGAFNRVSGEIRPRMLSSELTSHLDRKIYDEWKGAIEAIYVSETKKPSLNFPPLNAAKKESALSALTAYYRAADEDPHARVVSVEDYEASARASEVGDDLRIGLQSEDEKRGMRVTRIVPGGPAFRAGLREGDLILSQNGEPALSAQILAEVSRATDHVLEFSVQRQIFGEVIHTFTVKIKAAPVTERFVTSQRLPLKEERFVGYVRMMTFGSVDGCGEVRAAMTRMRKAGVSAWILDLRGNRGGRATQEACIEGLFLESSRVSSVTREWFAGKLTGTVLATEFPLAPTIEVNSGVKISAGIFPVKEPLVVLVDEMTISAAEYAAGSLRFHGRALLVGLPTFGKGCEVRTDDAIAAAEGMYVFRTRAVMSYPDSSTHQIFGLRPDFPLNRGSEFDFQRESHPLSEGTLSPRAISSGLPEVRFGHSLGYDLLRQCVSEFRAEEWYQKNRGGPYLPDVQLEAAKEVAECWRATGYPVLGHSVP